MGLLSFRRKKSDDANQLYSLLELVQAGDEQARNELIEAYIPFVLRTASQACKRYIDKGRDEEFSIALMAMNEAIERFDTTRKANFLGFAETIIRRRLIDYFRAQKAQQRQVPWTEFDITDEDDNVMNYVEVRTSVELHERAEEQALRQQEIGEYAKLLSQFGLSFSELVELSPKHADARQNAMDVARTICSDEEMMQFVFERKSLPLKLLEERVGVSRKTMERQRKYILAVVILLHGDFQFLKHYVS